MELGQTLRSLSSPIERARPALGSKAGPLVEVKVEVTLWDSSSPVETATEVAEGCGECFAKCRLYRFPRS